MTAAHILVITAAGLGPFVQALAALTGQRGHDVIILRRPRLAEIATGEVVAALKQRR